MTRRFIGVLVVLASGCAVDSSTTAAPDAPAAPAPALSASVRASWSGQDVTSSDPNDSRVPRVFTGPAMPCPTVVGDDVVQVEIEVVIGTENAFVGDATVDCALGHMTMAVPEGSGMFRLDVFTAAGYAWLAAYAPITTIGGHTTDGIADLNNDIPTSGGGGGDDDGGGGLGGYL